MDGKNWPQSIAHLIPCTRRQPDILAFLIAQMVSAAGPCLELLEWNRKRKGLIWRLPEPDDYQWYYYYGHLRRLRRDLLGVLGVPSEEIYVIEGMFSFLRWTTLAGPEGVKQFYSELFKHVRPNVFVRYGRLTRHRTFNRINEIDSQVLDEDDIRERVCHPAMVFFLRCEFPFWLRHGMVPQQVLWQATDWRNPVLAAVEALVRNDKRCARHPLMLQALERASSVVRKKLQASINASLQLPPRKVKPATLKNRLSGLASKIAQWLGCNLEARNIRAYFDCHAKLEGRAGGIPVDFDINASAGNFRRYVNNGRDFWNLA